jgi:pyruvate dehydrogenase E2 component (dihydrolipoamide acetyltransferase)
VTVDVVLPNLGFGMEEGKLIEWLKQPGDSVRKGETIAVIEGDKANVDFEAVVDGTLDVILVAAGSVVPVGSVLARISTGDKIAAPPAAVQSEAQPEKIAQESASQRVSPVAQRVASVHGIDVSGLAGSGPGGRIVRNDVQAVIAQKNGVIQTIKPLAAPAVRKLARDRGIDLRNLIGTGRDGHITRADVESALVQPQIAAAPVQAIMSTAEIKSPASAPASNGDERHEITLSQMRKTIGRRLTQIAQEAPHFYVTAELDLTHALKKLPKEIGINNLLLYLTIQALHDVPALNATYEDGHLYEYPQVNLAVAVALDNGLMTPVLHHADDFSLAGLAQRSRDLIERARAGKLRQDELQGGTFTVSNLGVVKQIEKFTAILNPPQVAIMAVGAAKDRPFVIDGGLFVRKTVHLTLSADHRIIDGLLAARFLEAFDARLQAFAG